LGWTNNLRTTAQPRQVHKGVQLQVQVMQQVARDLVQTLRVTTEMVAGPSGTLIAAGADTWALRSNALGIAYPFFRRLGSPLQDFPWILWLIQNHLVDPEKMHISGLPTPSLVPALRG
jgi:hypothetical protein